MPTTQLSHGPDVVMPWLSNLLPDAEEVRSRWAAKFGERRTDPFTLLAHMGDLISAHGIWAEDRITFTAKAAVKYGKERSYSKISGRNLARTADVLGTPRSAFSIVLEDMAEHLPRAFEAAIAEVPEGMVTDLLRQMPARIERFAAEYMKRWDSEDLGLRALPRFQGSTSVSRPDTGRIWEPGRWRGGRWVSGRYRTRRRR